MKYFPILHSRPGQTNEKKRLPFEAPREDPTRSGRASSTGAPSASANLHSHDTSLFPRLVLVWVNADFRVQIRIFQHFSRSTRKSSSRKEILQNFGDFCRFLQKFSQNFGKWPKWSENLKIFTKFRKISLKIEKMFNEIMLIFCVASGAKDCKSCRSRKMLKNDYLVAKIGVDTDQNEPRNGHKNRWSEWPRCWNRTSAHSLAVRPRRRR